MKTKLLPTLPTAILPFILFLVLMAGFSSLVSGQTTMAHWGLNNNLNVDNDNVVGTPSATQSGLASSNSSTPCEGTYHYYASGSNDYLQISINTTGFYSVTISWQQKQSTLGGNGNWYLTGDADNNGTYEYSKTDNANVTSSCATISVTLDNTFNNKGAIQLRLTSHLTSGSYLIVDDVTIRGCATPTAYSVTGGGSYCSGGEGVEVGLANSETGVNYQLYRNDGTTAVGTAVSGTTGQAKSFGFQTIDDTYTVVATRTSGGCTADMTGSAIVTLSAPPSAPTTTGAYFCTGTTVSLTASGAVSGDKYKWYDAATDGNLLKTSSNNTDNTFTTPILTNTTNYWVSILTAAGCESNRVLVTATVSNPVANVTGQKNISCYAGSDGEITVSASGGQSPYTFSVDNGQHYLPATGTDIRLFTGLQANTQYKIRVKDANNCESPIIP